MSNAHFLRLWLLMAIACTTLAGCSNAYDRALKDLSMSDDERMRMRIDELLQCADHTLRSLDEAASLYCRAVRNVSEQAKLDACVNEAEAGAFQLMRRRLSVQDVAHEMGRSNDENVMRLLSTTEECRTRATLIIEALRLPDDADSLQETLAEVRRSVAALHKITNIGETVR